jgi:hypothetical protein
MEVKFSKKIKKAIYPQLKDNVEIVAYGTFENYKEYSVDHSPDAFHGQFIAQSLDLCENSSTELSPIVITPIEGGDEYILTVEHEGDYELSIVAPTINDARAIAEYYIRAAHHNCAINFWLTPVGGERSEMFTTDEN